MKILFAAVFVLLIVFAALIAFTYWQSSAIEARYPPAGSSVEIDGRDLHFLDMADADDADLPPILFVHGASGNLLDQALAYRETLEGRARLVFVDRPGHGYSGRNDADATIAGQGKAYADLLTEIGVEKAVVVCHSMGCASAAAMAVLYPEKVAGLVFVAPATHPWPGGVSWHYDVAAMPYFGWLFTRAISLPAGMVRLKGGVDSVFTPNSPPVGYSEDSAVSLVLRPHQFRANGIDVATLNQQVRAMQKRYSEIKKPTIIITGNKDDVVFAEIHSIGLERDIEGSKLIVLDGIGHKPDYEATDVVVKAIEEVSGLAR